MRTSFCHVFMLAWTMTASSVAQEPQSTLSLSYLGVKVEGDKALVTVSLESSENLIALLDEGKFTLHFYAGESGPYSMYLKGIGTFRYDGGKVGNEKSERAALKRGVAREIKFTVPRWPLFILVDDPRKNLTISPWNKMDRVIIRYLGTDQVWSTQKEVIEVEVGLWKGTAEGVVKGEAARQLAEAVGNLDPPDESGRQGASRTSDP